MGKGTTNRGGGGGGRWGVRQPWGRVIHEGEARVQNGRHRPPADYVCVDTGDALPGQGSRSLAWGYTRRYLQLCGVSSMSFSGSRCRVSMG